MLEYTSFTFDGISTNDLGLMAVQKSGGLFDETFLPSRSLNTTSIYKRKKNYFKGVDVSPLSFTITLWLKQWKDRRNLREIARWLNTNEYRPFWFNDEPDKVFYCTISGESRITHNGLFDGTIDVTFTCDSEYSYSHPLQYLFSVNGTENWEFFNEGDETIYPFLKITQKENNRPIIIRNKTLNGEFRLNNVLLNEVVSIDCENRIIKSDRESNIRYLYDFHNGYWLPFEGEEYRQSKSSYKIEFEGRFDIEFNVEYKYLQGGNGY